MDYSLFGRMMEMVHLDPYYRGVVTGDHTNSLYYAAANGKVLSHWSGDEMIGFCTYGWFTCEELAEDRWSGAEVYSRGSGDVLYIPKFLCRAGRREVFRFVREIQRELSRRCPEAATANCQRVYDQGSSRNGTWYRKAA
jgi:hypothetical protein